MSEYRPGPASHHTRQVFERALADLPFCDERDEDDAWRGWLADLPADFRRPSDVPADDSEQDIHPSLRRIRTLREAVGVFEVVPGVFQVRGLSPQHVTAVDSAHGRILLDPPTDESLTRIAGELLDRVVGQRPTVGVLHSRNDGGSRTIGGLEFDGVRVESVPVRDPNVPSVFRWFPGHGLLYTGDAVRHSLLPLVVDGQVRDPLVLAKLLHSVLGALGDLAEVVLGSVDWPTWGSTGVRQLLADQRDLLRFVHDEVVRLGAAGHSVAQTVERLELPPALAVKWYARGYDSTLDAQVLLLHPARDEVPLPAWPGQWPGQWPDQAPSEGWEASSVLDLAAAGPLVDWAGGLQAATERLRFAYRAGDYRWVALAGEQVLGAVPEAATVRLLTARAYEQLAQQEENLARHAAFASRARALATVNGGPGPQGDPARRCVLGAGPEQAFDRLAVRVNGPRAWGHTFCFRWTVEDTGRTHLLSLRNGALFAPPEAPHEADGQDPVGVISSRAVLGELACRHTDWPDVLRTGRARVVGDARVVEEFFELLDPWPCRPTDTVTPLRPRETP